MSFSNTKLNKEQLQREKRKKDYQANKGNWEYSFFQKTFDPNEESNRKVLLKPSNNIDPNNFHLHINPTLSREEDIFNRNKSGKKISKTESPFQQNSMNFCILTARWLSVYCFPLQAWAV